MEIEDISNGMQAKFELTGVRPTKLILTKKAYNDLRMRLSTKLYTNENITMILGLNIIIINEGLIL